MTSNEPTRVEVSRRIGAGASEIFSILADPGRHTDIDGSGMLRGAITDSVVSRVGDVFAMKMYYEQFGDYEMDNHVVQYEAGRRIGWEPVAHGEERGAESPQRNGSRWMYALTPEGPNATMVTESYDCSGSPEAVRQAVDNGNSWMEAMAATLERLDEVSTGER